MGMDIRINVADLARVAKHLESLSFGKTDLGDTYITVECNYLKAKGDLYDTEVYFGRDSQASIAEICMKVGIPFIYS